MALLASRLENRRDVLGERHRFGGLRRTRGSGRIRAKQCSRQRHESSKREELSRRHNTLLGHTFYKSLIVDKSSGANR